MKILLSAYACEPNSGSDKEVGWQWAIRLAKLGHEVWVLVRSIHRVAIEKEFEINGQPDNLHYVYCELDWFIRNSNWFKGRIYIYYYLWQWVASTKAIKLHKGTGFDVVHHVTWVSVRQPSFMGRIGIPFIFGPCGGGESAPLHLRIGYSPRQWISDVARDVTNSLVKLDPFMRYVFKSANDVFVTSEQSKSLIPEKYKGKSRISLAIGIDKISDDYTVKYEKKDYGNNSFNVLHVGRFVCWKGMHLGLHAFSELKSNVPRARLTMVGKGNDEELLRKIAKDLNIDDAIDWIPWVEQGELYRIYKEHDCFLFPSLHDSGGLVVLEAMRMGLPVVCMNLGGPGVIVNSSCGFIVNGLHNSRKIVISLLAESMQLMANDNEVKKRLSMGAQERVKHFTWEKLINDVYKDVCSR